VNLPRALPKSKASLKSSTLRRTGSIPSVASTHSDLSTYSNNCKLVLCQTFEIVEGVVTRKTSAVQITSGSFISDLGEISYTASLELLRKIRRKTNSLKKKNLWMNVL
jgi:hypothetical protein